jgi:nitrogen fixation NifU-like protein
MSDLRDLYQEVILDHSKRPRNFGPLEGKSHDADGFNPLCGDQLHLDLRVEDGTVIDVRFSGSGCAISTASASVMTEMLKGKSVAEVHALVERFTRMVTTPLDHEPDTEGMGKLVAFAGVREFPVRIKCATLCWHTLEAALAGKDEASTE